MPAPIDYLDFDLEVEATATPGTFAVSVVASPTGEASSSMVFPYNADALENVILKLGRTRSGVRGLGSPSQTLARSFGSALYDAAFSGEVGTCFRRSLDAADAQGRGLRVRLRLDKAPELADVPWEYLYPTGLRQFLVLSTRTPVVRYVEQPRPAPPLQVDGPLSILVIVSAPSDLATLDVAAEVARVQGSLAGVVASGGVRVTVLETATLAELRRMLRRDTFHVLHFIGHGGFDTASGGGMLAFEDEQGRSHLVSGMDLATILHDHTTLRLAVLNACEGARQSPVDPFGGVAQSLVMQGLPAVVAMQFEISDQAATTLSGEFYAALADGYPIDAALAQARVAVFSSDNDVEWGTPVLHLRASDGRIFEVAGTNASNLPKAASGPVAAPAAPERSAEPPPRGRRAGRVLVGVVAAVLVLGLTWWWLGRPGPTSPQALPAPASAPARPQPTASTSTPPASTAPSAPAASTTASTAPVTLPPVQAVAPLRASRGAVTIDGDSGDWSWQLVSEANRPLAGSTPVTASTYLMWDADALYLLAQVADTTADPPDAADPARMYRGDAVVLELGPDNALLTPSVLARPIDAYYLFGVTGPGTTVTSAVLGANPARTSFEVLRPATGVTAAAVRTASGYTLEARIPWALTKLNGVGAGARFAANVVIADRRRTSLSNQGMVTTNPQRTRDLRAHPAYWQRLELVG